MDSDRQYTIHSLYRYPVKSMAGEKIGSISVTERGLCGDRAYALVDTQANKAGSAKDARRFGQLLSWHAELIEPFSEGSTSGVRLTLPEGRVLKSTDEEIDSSLAEVFGKGVKLSYGAPDGLVLAFAAGTLGGKFADTTELPISSGAPKGTLFNYAAVHLITTSTLRRLDMDADRFRPNIIVDTGDEAGFPENDWIGQSVRIGKDLALRVSIPCPRCVVPTLPRRSLPLDSSVLRRVAERNTIDLGEFGTLPCAGVYAEVLQPGVINQDDVVRFF